MREEEAKNEADAWPGTKENKQSVEVDEDDDWGTDFKEAQPASNDKEPEGGADDWTGFGQDLVNEESKSEKPVDHQPEQPNEQTKASAENTTDNVNSANFGPWATTT